VTLVLPQGLVGLLRRPAGARLMQAAAAE